MKFYTSIKHTSSDRQPILKSGFTLIELIVSISVIILITAIILVNYRKFDSTIYLTNLSYDTALSIRKAQTYGLSVRGYSPASGQFNYAYGIHWGYTSTDPNSRRLQYVLFVDTLPAGTPAGEGLYGGPSDTGGDYSCNPTTDPECVEVDTINRGNHFGSTDGTTGLCATPLGQTSETCNLNKLDITFLRPNPDATIYANGGPANSAGGGFAASAASIHISSNDLLNEREVIVQSTGQISVKTVQ